MGPRLITRKRTDFAVFVYLVHFHFNGAAFNNAEKARNQDDRRLCWLYFNGAAFNNAEKELRRKAYPHAHRHFNGAAFNNAEKAFNKCSNSRCNVSHFNGAAFNNAEKVVFLLLLCQ